METKTAKISDYIGFIEKAERKVKPIKFKFLINDSVDLEGFTERKLIKDSLCKPCDYKEVIHLYYAADLDMDVMLAVPGRGNEPTIYYGHWNDGVVK